MFIHLQLFVYFLLLIFATCVVVAYVQGEEINGKYLLFVWSGLAAFKIVLDAYALYWPKKNNKIAPYESDDRLFVSRYPA